MFLLRLWGSMMSPFKCNMNRHENFPKQKYGSLVIFCRHQVFRSKISLSPPQGVYLHVLRVEKDKENAYSPLFSFPPRIRLEDAGLLVRKMLFHELWMLIYNDTAYRTVKTQYRNTANVCP